MTAPRALVYIPGRSGIHTSHLPFPRLRGGCAHGEPRASTPVSPPARGIGFSMKRLSRLGLSIALSAGLIALCFRGANLSAVWQALMQAHPGYLLLAVVLSLVTFVGRAFRWRSLLGHLKRGIGFPNLFSCTVIGFMVSYVLPLRVGELARPILLANKEGMSKGAVIATVAVARMMDFLAVLLLFSVYLIGFSSRLPDGGSEWMAQFRARGIVVGCIILLAVVALYGVVFLRERLFRRLEALTRSGGFGRRLVDFLHTLVRGFEVLKGGRALAVSMLLTLATWCLIDLSILAGLRAFEIPVGFVDVFLLMAFLAVGIAVPAPAGLGSYQYSGLLCLETFLQIDRDRALAAIWAQWGVAVLPVVALGAILIWREGLTVGQVGRMVSREERVSS